jgi:hypothetical protein
MAQVGDYDISKTLQDLTTWEATESKLDRLDRLGPYEGSYMASLGPEDYDLAAGQHSEYLAAVTAVTSDVRPFDSIDPTWYLLSADILGRYNSRLPFLFYMIPVLRGALENARPHPHRFSILMFAQH